MQKTMKGYFMLVSLAATLMCAAGCRTTGAISREKAIDIATQVGKDAGRDMSNYPLAPMLEAVATHINS
jgi:hypothetical protein